MCICWPILHSRYRGLWFNLWRWRLIGLSNVINIIANIAAQDKSEHTDFCQSVMLVSSPWELIYTIDEDWRLLVQDSPNLGEAKVLSMPVCSGIFTYDRAGTFFPVQFLRKPYLPYEFTWNRKIAYNTSTWRGRLLQHVEDLGWSEIFLSPQEILCAANLAVRTFYVFWESSLQMLWATFFLEAILKARDFFFHFVGNTSPR